MMQQNAEPSHDMMHAGVGLGDLHEVHSSGSIQTSDLRAVKHGDSFALFDPHGDIVGTQDAPDGIYFRDTRHISFWRMTVCGSYPLLLGSAIDDRIDALIVDLTNADCHGVGRTRLPKDVLHFRRIKFLHEGRAFERLSVRNFDRVAHHFSIEITLGADFRDMFEIRGDRRDRRGDALPPQCSSNSLIFAYRGLDAIERRTSMRFEPAPTEMSPHKLRFDVMLEPGQSRVFYTKMDFGDSDDEEPTRAFLEAYRALRNGRRAGQSRKPRIGSSNRVFDALIERSAADLTTLTTDSPQGLVAYAGIPWYCTLFGRDALLTALQTLWYDPTLARGTLLRLAALQATEDDAAADAEPGKILHEMRAGEMANTGEIPFKLYYGSCDSTPLFVYLAGEYFRQTGDRETLESIWPNLNTALEWIDRSGDRDGDGFFEYGRRNDSGLRNQGWKDSHDAISHADGTLADGPIALVEMQAYVFGAWQAMAALCDARGQPDDAKMWRERAAALRDQFARQFFDVEMGTYILALDGAKRPCRVTASNAGHALLTGIALDDHAHAVASRLMQADCFSGWGIRTLSRDEKRYNPMSYHNGSIWPHDNALIAAGFARYGMRTEVDRLFTALFEASSYFDQQRFPELFCGFGRKWGHGPTLYPVACAPQAWSSAVPFFLTQAILGMSVRAEEEIRFAKPSLPTFLDKISLDGLRCGNSKVDLDILRMTPATSVFVRSGPKNPKLIVEI